jgi:putative effector of murein hydrolase
MALICGSFAAGVKQHAIQTVLVTAFMVSVTLSSFVLGTKLPKRLAKVTHPLVTCMTLSWAAMASFAAITHQSFISILRQYRTGSFGAGDILLFALGPAVVSLAISMYGRRQLMRDNFLEVVSATTVSTFGGLFGTAWAVQYLHIANRTQRLSLLSRNITSPLAMAISKLLGGDISLAVTMVVVTGLLGANFGASFLDLWQIHDPVARGLGIGAAAHGLGTAALVQEENSFPFAAIAMALTASAATVIVSIPVMRDILISIALCGCRL